VQKIVLTGPESSGKSTLAQALGRVWGVPVVPEFARSYVQHLGRAYTRADLRAIGRGQRAWEDWWATRYAPNTLLCDTDWTVLHIWEAWKYAHSAPFQEVATAAEWVWQQGYGPPRPADLYLLCTPDFTWEPDSLREHPNERDALFQRYELLLQTLQVPYMVLEGSVEERIEDILTNYIFKNFR
jgi:nicotinamide riboside kinase